MERFYDELPRRRVFHGRSPAQVRQRFDRPLPASPAPLDEIVRQAAADLVETTTLSASPDFFGYVVSGGSQAGILAALLSTAVNVCGGKWRASAAHAEIERTAVRWIAEFIGLPDRFGGVLTSGGSQANLLALAVARKIGSPHDVRARGQSAGSQPVVYASTEAHSSVRKSVELLGIGSDHLRGVPVDREFRMDPSELLRMIRHDRDAGRLPLAVVATAGTTNTVAIDPLAVIGAICRRHGMWLHVDGAYGAPAAATERCRQMFVGLEAADSITVDPHKWLHVPFEAGCLLVRHADHLRSTFAVVPEYLADGDPRSDRLEWHEYGFQLTRDLKGLKVWMTFLAYGSRELAAAIDRNIVEMRDLAGRIDAATDFELAAPTPLSAVCFRFLPAWTREGSAAEVDLLQQRLVRAVLDDGRVYLATTRLRGRTVLRACSTNHRLTRRNTDRLLSTLRRLGAEIAPGVPSSAQQATRRSDRA